MKKLYAFVLCLSLSTLFICCKKETDIPAPTPPDVSQPTQPTGSVTPVGDPIGPVITATIGPAGGRIESNDQRIRIDIPAGALANNQTISVQALDKNHCPGGAGLAFRLLPHGLTFAKPATVTFEYKEEEIDDTAPELLRIAYQGDDHSWYSPPTARLDTPTKLVITQTAHFSDWTLLKSAQLDPTVGAVDPGGSIVLSVRSHIESTNSGEENIPVYEKVDDKYIKEWTVQGKGHLSGNGTTVATYTAPEQIPASNPEVVTVLLKATSNNMQREIRLKSKIYVLAEGLVFRINRGTWIPTTSPLGLTRVSRGDNYFLTVQTGLSAPGLFASVSLSWPAVGVQDRASFSYTLPWQLKTDDNELQIPIIYLSTNPAGHPIYTFFYEEGKKAYPSPGSLQILKKLSNDYYIGSFTIKKAGVLDYSGGTDPLFDGIAEVEGFFRFKVKREL